MNTFKFGIATIDDLPYIVKLKLAMFFESGHFALLAANAEDVILNDYRHLYTSDKARHFVTRVDGCVVAMAGAFIKSDLPYRYFKSSTYGFIGDVYTKPSFRNRGVATRLNKAALRWLKTQNVEMVRLLASDTGRPLYKKLGFVPTDEMVLLLEQSR